MKFSFLEENRPERFPVIDEPPKSRNESIVSFMRRMDIASEYLFEYLLFISSSYIVLYNTLRAFQKLSIYEGHSSSY